MAKRSKDVASAKARAAPSRRFEKRRERLRSAAIDEFKKKHGVTTIVPFIADNFDEPLPEDFLLRPLPPDV